jgi:DNA polymerase-3 subunit epsilon
LIDAGDAPSDSISVVVSVDLRQYALPILSANAQELVAHEEVLLQLDKASGGKTVWRQGQLA